MSTTIAASRRSTAAPRRTARITPHRELRIFLVIALASGVEDLAQAFEIYVLGWKIQAARGGLGLLWPWLVSSEALHYAYALVMLVGFLYLRKYFDGRAGAWWAAALVLQVWHHLEHQFLLGQAIVSQPLFGAATPTSFLELVAPRVELHLFYDAVVFTPMVVAMHLRRGQIRDEEQRAARAVRL